jgi:hypothetical protein
VVFRYAHDSVKDAMKTRIQAQMRRTMSDFMTTTVKSGISTTMR